MSLKMYANLHNHTTHSDGVFTPEELVRVAKEEGYKAVAATDHDTVTAYPEMKAACDKYGMETVFGCEFTAICDRYRHIFRDYHLIGFDFDPEHPVMKDYLRKCSEVETAVTVYLFETAQRDGLLTKAITWQDVLDYNPGITWLCNDHVRHAMEEMHLVTDKEWSNYFDTCFSAPRQIAVDAWKNKSVHHEKLQIEALIDLIHDAGGIAVLAHPGEQNGQMDTIPDMAKCGIDGIEVWHGDNRRQGVEKRVLELARDYDLYISGGEDHSGLCGGTYKFYDHPEETIYYMEELSLGTRKEFYEEIRDRKKNPDRVDIINEYLKFM